MKNNNKSLSTSYPETVKTALNLSQSIPEQVRSRLTDFPISNDLFSKMGSLHYHPGYSSVKDLHLYDPDFPSAITCTPSEAELLHTLIYNLKPERPVEIGSYMGWSTAHIISALGNRKLHCIEPFFETDASFNQKTNEHAAERFRQNMDRCGYADHIELITLPSPQCLSSHCPTGGWDFLFLDGWHNHGQPLRDVEGMISLLSPNAVVALHDPWVPDVRDAMLRLMYFGFSIYSLDTANFLTVCFRGTPFIGWRKFCKVASETRHRLEQAEVMRHYLGLCEISIGEVSKVLNIPCLYYGENWLSKESLSY